MQITFGDLRSLLQKEPSLSLWDRILSLLGDRKGKADYRQWKFYVQESVKSWPSQLRRTGPPNLDYIPLYNYIPLSAKEGVNSLWLSTLKQAANQGVYPATPFCLDLSGQVDLSGHVHFWESVYAVPLSYVERSASVNVYTNAHGLKIMCQNELWADKLTEVTCLSFKDRILQLSCDPLPQLRKLTLQNSFFTCPQGFPPAFSNLQQLMFLDCHLSHNDCDSAYLPNLKHLSVEPSSTQFALSNHLPQLETLRLRERRCAQNNFTAYLNSSRGFPVDTLKHLYLSTTHDMTPLVDRLSNLPFQKLESLDLRGSQHSRLHFDSKRVRWSPEVIQNILT